MTEETKKIVCPNCGAQAIKDGTKIVCEACDATYTFKKTGGAKVVDIGRLDSIENRLACVESRLPGQDPDPADPPDPDEPYNPNSDNILGPE